MSARPGPCGGRSAMTVPTAIANHRNATPAYTSGSVKTSADIRIEGDSIEVSFEWRDVDGDDCFNDFHINVITETGTRRFDFGGCAVNGLRQFSRFFRARNKTYFHDGIGSWGARCLFVSRETLGSPRPTGS
jgi:hypothetical protein